MLKRCQLEEVKRGCGDAAHLLNMLANGLGGFDERQADRYWAQTGSTSG